MISYVCVCNNITIKRFFIVVSNKIYERIRSEGKKY